jgi:ATP-dependent DNA helicase RecQ
VTQDPTLARDATELLHALAGPQARLRESQLEAVAALVADQRRVVVVQRTGWGKSAVYWIATALRRRNGSGPTLVVSPLLALMRDQVAKATSMGITAVTLNSTNFDEWSDIEAAILADKVDVILISPERLNAQGFRDRILVPLAHHIGMLVIDEAHCVSDWGFDFRPDYQRIRDVIAAMPPQTPVLATTATANKRVTADVAAQLGEDTLTLRGSLERESLRLAVVNLPTTVARYAWISTYLATLAGSGIIYALTVEDTRRLAGFLRQEGHQVTAYSGQTETDDREEIEAALLTNQLRAVVATSALGMGFDKPDLSFVIHLGAPSSPIAYYQQIGRAGRGVERADAVLLPAGVEDERIWEYFLTTSFPPPETYARILEVLESADEPRSVADIVDATGIRQGRVDVLLKILDVAGAVERDRGTWIRTASSWTYDAERVESLRQIRRVEQRAMRMYQRTDQCLMAYIRAELDDPTGPCGRCQNCAPESFPVLDVAAATEPALIYLRRVVNELTPRKMWPRGMDGYSGPGGPRRGGLKHLAIEPGRALAYASDPGWGDALGRALAGDQPIDDALFQGVVDLLGLWSKEWSQRPEWVTWIPSRRRDRLLADLARRLGEVGGLPVIPVLRRVANTPRQDELDVSSRQASNVLDALTVAPNAQVPPGPVLLLDDTARSTWTITVAGALLREAGSGRVLPLVLHRQP